MPAKNTFWMCVAFAAAILAACLVVVLATPTKRAEAAFPGQNGKIAFESQLLPGESEIVTMNANGDNKTALTNNLMRDENPAYSPNGRKIAFASSRSGNLDIFTMSANGTDKKRVTTSTHFDFSPSWSPNGTKIAFASRRNGNTDIYVINQDRTGLTRLTTSPRIDYDPAWSPDGTRIAFVRGQLSSVNGKIYVMKVARESETNRPQRLTTSGLGIEEFDPAWSPDGTRIAFVSDQSAPFLNDYALYAIRADGSGETRLAIDSFGRDSRFDPTWSPDGTKIAFSAYRSPDSTLGIFVMKAAPESETNRPKRLTGNATHNFSPDWQPLR